MTHQEIAKLDEILQAHDYNSTLLIAIMQEIQKEYHYLPEEALVGGDLVRLRLRPSVSPAWLLAWLRGPGETVCTKTAGCKSRCCESTGSPSRRDRRSLDRSFCCTGPWRKRRLNLPNGLKPCLTLFCAGSFPKARWKSPLGNSPRIA